MGQLALDAGPGGQAQVALRITVPEPQVTVTPAALRLGAAYRGETRTAGLTVNNQGGSPCDVKLAGGADWAKITPDHFRCASGKSVAVTIAADTSRMGIGTHRTAVSVTAEAGGWRQETPVTAEVELPWLKTFARRYRMALAGLAVVLVLLAAWGGVQLQKQLAYNRGQTLLAAGRWEESITAFARAGSHRDAPTQILEAHYQAGQARLAAGQWEQAWWPLPRLGITAM